MEELPWKVLVLTAGRGHIGATREDFFREIRGIAYADLEEALRELESEGLIQIDWTGIDKFLCTVTEKGGALAAGEYAKRLAAYKKRMEEQHKSSSIEKI
jgi:hypothetical protein